MQVVIGAPRTLEDIIARVWWVALKPMEAPPSPPVPFVYQLGEGATFQPTGVTVIRAHKGFAAYKRGPVLGRKKPGPGPAMDALQYMLVWLALLTFESPSGTRNPTILICMAEIYSRVRLIAWLV